METEMNNRVLFIDDEPYYVRSLIDSLIDEGYEVIVADSIREAIQQLKKATPDLIILDSIMPQEELERTHDGLRTGVRLLEIIRDDMRIRTPMLFVTVVDSQEMEDRIREIEERHRLPRPVILVKVVLPSELLREVRRKLSQR